MKITRDRIQRCRHQARGKPKQLIFLSNQIKVKYPRPKNQDQYLSQQPNQPSKPSSTKSNSTLVNALQIWSNSSFSALLSLKLYKHCDDDSS